MVGEWKYFDQGDEIRITIYPTGRMDTFYQNGNTTMSAEGFGMRGWSSEAGGVSEVDGTMCFCCTKHLKLQRVGDGMEMDECRGEAKKLMYRVNVADRAGRVLNTEQIKVDMRVRMN